MSGVKRPYFFAGPVQSYICHRNIDREIAALHEERLRFVELAVVMAAMPVADDFGNKRESVRLVSDLFVAGALSVTHIAD